ERDLSVRARVGLGRPARGGANARAERAAGADAGPRAAGVPLGARADDQRLHRAAQGLVARLGPDGARADQGNADLRHQPGRWGDPRLAGRRALPRDVAAAGRARPQDGSAMAAPGRMTAAGIVLEIAEIRLQRGVRPILNGASLGVTRGELVALMGPSGSG